MPPIEWNKPRDENQDGVVHVRRGFSTFKMESTLGYLLILPALMWLVALVAYPFCLSIYYALSDAVIGAPSKFAGLKNYRELFTDEIFIQTVKNSFVFTVSAIIFKTAIGLSLALLLNRNLRFKRVIRGSVLLPWVVPTALSTLGWLWMYDSLFSVFTWTINWFLKLQFLKFLGFSPVEIAKLMIKLGLKPLEINWLGDPTLAMISVIAVNVWRGTPFFAICILAGLVAIPSGFYEAAEVDGAGAFSKFWHITLPMLRPVLAVVLLFSTVFTFAEFNIVFVLTGGGPMNSTHLFGTLTNLFAFTNLQLGKGAAVSLFMFPILVTVVLLQLRYIRRE